jgi:hypothetical protein
MGPAAIFVDDSSVVTIHGASIVTTGTTTAGGAIAWDPDFVTTARGDFRLGSSSDALSRCAIGLPDDLDGESRGTRHDMGALERP